MFIALSRTRVKIKKIDGKNGGAATDHDTVLTHGNRKDKYLVKPGHFIHTACKLMRFACG